MARGTQALLDECRAKRDADAAACTSAKDALKATITSLEARIAELEAEPDPDPNPDPDPEPSAWGTYSGTNQPPASWTYFGPESHWNTKPSTAVAPYSQTVVNSLLTYGTELMNPSYGIHEGSVPFSGAHALCWSSPFDPEFTVRMDKVTWSVPYAGARVRIPAKAMAGQDGYDYQLAVIDQDAGKVYSFWQFERKGGAYVKRANGEVWCSAMDIADIGADSGTGLETGYATSTQAGFSLPGGQIRGEEILAGHINHGLFLVVNGNARSGYHTKPSTSSSKYKPPAGYSPTKVDVGTHFRLNMTESEIRAKPIKEWEKIVLTAFAEYGAWVGDGGGASWGSIEMGSSATYAQWGLRDPWYDVASQAGIAAYTNSSGQKLYPFKWTAGQIDWRTKLQVLLPPS